MRRKISVLIENYVETFRASRLLTQLFSFCAALILLLSVAESVYTFVTLQDAVSDSLRKIFMMGLLAQSLVGFLFASRFVLLFFKDKRVFWLSQLVWLVTYLTLLSLMSSPESGGCTKNAFPLFGENMSYALVAYLLFSPIRQLLTFLISLSKNSFK